MHARWTARVLHENLARSVIFESVPTEDAAIGEWTGYQELIRITVQDVEREVCKPDA